MTKTVDDTHRFEPDFILDAAKGRGFISTVVVGLLPDGEIWVSSTDGSDTAIALLIQGGEQVANMQEQAAETPLDS